MTSAVRALVSGRVQGVAFRHFTKVEARRLGLRGWVRNLDDGRVETWIEGDEAALEELVAWLHHGPPAAHVERVVTERVAAAGHAAFVVARP